MKLIKITLKDLKHTFKSIFSLVMMFVAPLLITGLLYFAFGGLGRGGGGFKLPATVVVIANLDQPSPQNGGFAAGEMLVKFLEDEDLTDILTISTAADEAGARSAVDAQRAGVAIVIPADFSAAALDPQRESKVVLYQDPTLTIGPSIVKGLVNHFMDGFSGAKIAGQVTASGLAAHSVQADARLTAEIAQQYVAWLQTSGHDSQLATPRMVIVAPGGQVQAADQAAGLVGPMMAGMIVLFSFFIGANGAESLIREDEEGTLKRLFTTPTGLTAIMGGKFVGIVVSLFIQVALLLLASTLLFGIRWGQPATVALVATGLIVAAAGFGVMLMSFIKSTRQTGPVMGGVMTLTGLLGGLFTTGIPNVPAAFDRFTLIVPQGWALQGWKLALSGAGPGQALVTVLVLCLMGAGFLMVGTALFRRRFA